MPRASSPKPPLPSSDPLLFAELQLLAAQRARRVSDFEASRDHLDKALVATFSLVGSSRCDAARLLVRIIGQLLDNYDTERALRVLAAADPLLLTIPSDSFLFVEFLLLRAHLMAYGRDYAGAAKVLQLALSKLDRLQLGPAHKLAIAGVRLQSTCWASRSCAAASIRRAIC